MSTHRIVAGFIPLLDCAVLVAAAERGFAAQEGVDLRLQRETSWANIRDRLIVGQLQAAHMLGPMSVAASLGAGHLRVPMVAALALGHGGNAITVSNALHAQMRAAGAPESLDPARQGAALAQVVQARAARAQPPLVVATVYPFSCHTYQLRYWLAACGIDAEDVQLVALPPPLLVDALREGQIDACCVGEPWSSVAVAADVGHIITTAAHIWQRPPEKVLGMRRDWLETHDAAALALVRALLRAAAWCDESANHADLARLLAEPRYVGVPAELLRADLAGELRLHAGAARVRVDDFIGFARDGGLQPRPEHAAWYYGQMLRWRQIRAQPDGDVAARAAFDGQLYARALASLGAAPPLAPREERFFDVQAGQVLHTAGA